MAQTRRALIAAASAFALPALAPVAADGRPWGRKSKGCTGREAYVGQGLRPQLFPSVFDAAEASAKARAHMIIHEELDEAFDKAAGQMRTQALCAAMITPDGGQWNQLRVPRGDPEPQMFFWASVGKAYTATAILQMVEEGKLGLEDRLSRWAPEAPGAAFIKIDDLLTHTSGLYSFQADPGLRAAPGYKAPDQLLAAAYAQPAAFCPGANWSYSNTGYVLLGRIIEAIDGVAYHEALTKRIVERLGLEETTILAPRQTPQGLAAPTASAAEAGGTADDLTTPFAAGAVAASALDVVRFWRGLMANRLHGQATTRGRFYRLYPMAGAGPGYYGQGVMVTDLYKVDPQSRDTWLGHAGGLPGAKALVAYSVQKNAFAAVALTGEGSPEAAANQLFAALPDAKTA